VECGARLVGCRDMRKVAFFVALAHLAGCTYYIQQPQGGETSSRETCATTSEGAGTEPLAATSDDEDDAQPPPAHAPREVGTFELVAHTVLQSVPYKDCGTGGRGDVDVTFQPNGTVQKVVVYANGWQPPAKQCVAERFALARVVPFAGDARTVRWHVQLSDGGWG